MKQTAAARKNLDTAVRFCALQEDNAVDAVDHMMGLFDPAATFVTLTGGVLRSLSGIQSALVYEKAHHWTTFRALRQITDNTFERTGHLQRRDFVLDYARLLEVRESLVIVDGKITLRTLQVLPKTGNTGHQFLI